MATRFHFRLDRAVPTIASAVLLTAAVGKLYGVRVSAVSEVGWLSQPSVQLLGSLWEIVLGLWLLSGRSPHSAGRVAMWTFGCFAAISLTLALNGVAKCGCLGAIPANPWGVFLLDSCLLALLIANSKLYPDRAPPLDSHSLRRSSVAGSILVAGILLTSSAAFGVVRYGSVQATLLRLQDYDVTLDDAYIDLGTAAVGQTLEGTVVVRNWSYDTIRIVGSPQNRYLSIRTKLPLGIPPGESRNVNLEMRIPDASAGALTIQTAIWTDSAKARSLQYRVGCRVAGLPPANSAGP